MSTAITAGPAPMWRQPQLDSHRADWAQQPHQPPPASGTCGTPKFDDSRLYEGRGPQPSDIQQDALGDCYFVSAAGAIAQQQPQVIRDAISYDPKTQSFNVTMYKKELTWTPLPQWQTRPVTINVTQAELRDNIARHGGSTLDNQACNKGAAWPAVLETAYAKMNDSNPADGLKQGYDRIANGGWPGDAMFALTGKESHTVSFDQGIGFQFTPKGRQDAVYNRVNDALSSGKPVTLSVQDESLLAKWFGSNDSLVDQHAYMVAGIRKDADGEVWVDLRNPWAHNNDGEGYDTPGALTSVKLSDLYTNGTATGMFGDWGFEIGG